MAETTQARLDRLTAETECQCRACQARLAFLATIGRENVYRLTRGRTTG